MERPIVAVLLGLCLSVVSASPLHASNKITFDCPHDGNFALSSVQCLPNYVICLQGVAYEQSCPGTSLFDPVSLICKSSSSDSCQTTAASTTTTGGFVCPDDGFYAFPGQCIGDYYVCMDGIAYVQSCPVGGVFDPLTIKCVNENKVSCRTTTTTTTQATTMQAVTTGPPFTCPAADGNFAIPGQCTPNYYICIGWISYPATCPVGSYFDPLTLRCASATTVSCFATTTAPPRTSTTISQTLTTTPTSSTPRTTTAASFVCPALEGNFPIPGQCSSNYYICMAYIPYLQTCPGGSYFDPLTYKCASAGNVSCLASTTAAIATSTTTNTNSTTVVFTTRTTDTPPAGSFECPAQNGDFANPVDCSTYYYCVNSVPSLMLCPPGLVYNPVISQCDWPYNVPGCTEQPGAPTTARPLTTISDITTKTTKTMEISTTSSTFVCHGPDGCYSVPGQCSSAYYDCVNSVPTLMMCPPGLVFNPVLTLCDWPYNVSGCADKQRD